MTNQLKKLIAVLVLVLLYGFTLSCLLFLLGYGPLQDWQFLAEQLGKSFLLTFVSVLLTILIYTSPLYLNISPKRLVYTWYNPQARPYWYIIFSIVFVGFPLGYAWYTTGSLIPQPQILAIYVNNFIAAFSGVVAVVITLFAYEWAWRTLR